MEVNFQKPVTKVVSIVETSPIPNRNATIFTAEAVKELLEHSIVHNIQLGICKKCGADLLLPTSEIQRMLDMEEMQMGMRGRLDSDGRFHLVSVDLLGGGELDVESPHGSTLDAHG